MSIIRAVQTFFGKKGLGYIPDPPDARDFMLSAHLGASVIAPPPSASVRNAQATPKDQGATSSCTGQSTSQAVRLAYLRAGIECPELSALFAYYQGRSLEGGPIDDNGAVIRDVIKALIRWGEANEAAWPFKVLKVNRHPSLGAYRSAFDRRGIRGYHRIISGDVMSVRRAIAAGFPVVAGWSIAQDFMDYDGKGVVQAQRAPFLGGHALCVTGYQANGTFELINSWSSAWAREREGYAIVSEGFMAQASDAWAIEV